MSWALRSAVIAAVVVASWAAAIAAVAVTALWVASIGVLVVTAFVAVLLVSGAGAWLAARGVRQSRRLIAGITAVSVLGLALLGGILVFRPLPSTPLETADAPADIEFWDLPTGSRLAYRHLAAVGPARPTPVIVVGGGPGEAMVADAAKADPFRRLTVLGFDVYLYDQIGAGRSDRLPDPSGYTVARHVADLEAIREQLGAQQVVLAGASWGGSLSASYLAEHPDRVAKAILTSPAPMDYRRHPGVGDITAHLPVETRERARALLPQNTRFLAWYGLGHVNPQAARNLLLDSEADAFFDTFLSIVRPATVCNPANLPAAHTVGNGLYANVFTVRDAESGAQSAVPQRLRGSQTPTLVITGECNYVPWAPTAEYATTLPHATLVCLRDAGHAPQVDRPELYRATVEAFLLDEPLPLPARPPDRPCHQ